MADMQDPASAPEELSALAEDCFGLLHAITVKPESVGYTKGAQLNAMRLAVLKLRLQSWTSRFLAARKSAPQSSGALDPEAARTLLSEVREDLRTARQGSEEAPLAQAERALTEEELSLQAVTEQIAALVLNSDGMPQGRQDKTLAWSLRNQKRTDRLLEDLTEHVDSLMQLLPTPTEYGSSDAQSKHAAPSDTTSSDVYSAFWLGVAAHSAAHSSLRQELVRIAAENIFGFAASSAAGQQGAADQPGHTYSNMSAGGNANVVYGNAYGGALFENSSK